MLLRNSRNIKSVFKKLLNVFEIGQSKSDDKTKLKNYQMVSDFKYFWIQA